MSLSELALDLPCAKCGAGVGQKCRTKSGLRATYSHAARSNALYAAWRDGYHEGRYDIASTYFDAIGDNPYMDMDRFQKIAAEARLEVEP